MTVTRAADDNKNTSMARAELAGMPVVLREGRFPVNQFHKVFGIQVTRRKVLEPFYGSLKSPRADTLTVLGRLNGDTCPR